jgi:serine/threonine-protein kinase RsbT
MSRIKHIISNEVDIHFLKTEVDQLFDSYGLNSHNKMKIYTILSELAYNQIKYANKGSIETSFIEEATRLGIKIKAIDKGPGIKDVELALKDNYSTGGTLGLGLPGIKRLVDDFNLRSVVNEGTTVEVVIWVQQ